MAGREKYEPSEKRFKIAQDPYSRERLKTVKALSADLKVRFPAVRTALSLFGSLSKGKQLNEGNAENADVDLACFYDAEDVLEHAGELLKTDPDFKERFERHKYMAESVDTLTSKRLNAVTQRAMAETLQNFVNERLAAIAMHPQLDKTVFTRSISMNGRDSIFEWVKTLKKLGGQRGFPFDPGQAVARSFHLDIGGGLKPYRQDFLQKLSQLDSATADEYWGIVNQHVQKWERLERHGEIPAAAEKQFPATFEAAVKYYGLPKERPE